MSELQEVMFNKRPGDKISLTFLHNKKSVTKTATLKNAQGNTKVVKQADMDVLGADVRPVTNQQKEQLNINFGLEVIKVNNGKIKDAGITKGFIIQKVNDENMQSVEDLQQAVKDASMSKEPVLIIRGVYPTGKKAYFVVELSSDE
jgi:S1-C subfamily serine protease